MSLFTLVILFDHFQFALIHGPNIPGSYAILFFATSDFFHHQSHPQLGIVFASAPSLHSFWSYFSTLLHSILGTYQPGEFIFQCPIFLPFHTVQGVLKARILKWFAIAFSSGPRFVITLHSFSVVIILSIYCNIYLLVSLFKI